MKTKNNNNPITTKVFVKDLDLDIKEIAKKLETGEDIDYKSLFQQFGEYIHQMKQIQEANYKGVASNPENKTSPSYFFGKFELCDQLEKLFWNNLE